MTFDRAHVVARAIVLIIRSAKRGEDMIEAIAAVLREEFDEIMRQLRDETRPDADAS